MNLAPSLTLVVMMLLAAKSAAETAAKTVCAPRPNTVLTDLGLHVINVGYQRTLGCWASLQASVGLYSPWLVNYNYLGLAGEDHTPPGDVIGGVVRLRAFFYPMANAPVGLWLSPFAQTAVVSGTRDAEVLVGPAFAVGLSAGWSWLIRERVLIALGVGGQFHLALFAGSSEFPGFVRFAPTFDLNVGYSF